MYKRLPADVKLQLIRQAQSGAKISTICLENNISRAIFYRWLKIYRKVGPRGKRSSLISRVNSSRNHWKSISTVKAKQILQLAIKSPELSIKDVAKSLNLSVYGVWSMLKKHNLNTGQLRESYIKIYGKSTIKYQPSFNKLMMIRRYLAGESAGKICQDFKVSRTIFYKWLRNYQNASEDDKNKILDSQRPKANKHWRFIQGEYEEAVLAAVREYPELSSHRLVWTLPQVGNTPIVSNHGIQNVLKRKNLSTFEQRIAFAKAYHKPTLTSYLLAFPQILLNVISSKEAWQRKLIVRLSLGIGLGIFFGIFIYGSISLARVIFVGHTFILSIGMLFSLISLIFGMLFLLYSLKYYFTIAIVLSFSRHQTQEKKGEGGIGLSADLSYINLDRAPFISIHLATYNEKKVIDRLLTAATSMEYENYEVILADDSTDETLEILKKWENHPRVKILHRATRQGFKGGALAHALKEMDKRAEFVIVLDADFIPYPDTITQFLKYFKASAGSLDYQTIASSNVAAIQGYQWHVLNKSENWITRGVRSEYAGSYVMERSATEIYSGLKQISGSVYLIRADVLKKLGWGTSITEDFELTLKLYQAGYKVVFTPYIQAPAEAVSTIKRLIRQRMRWAEGHSQNIKKMFSRIIFSNKLTRTEKLEFVYLSPYYLQSFFFIIGTLSWFTGEVVFNARLPFWTSTWGWSLILTNLIALPLMNMVGLFMEESDQKDYFGIFSFVAFSYLLAPFQGYASVKGFLEQTEGPWFRTPKSGKITDVFTPGRLYKFVFGVFGRKAKATSVLASFQAFSSSQYLSLNTSNNRFNSFSIKPKSAKWLGNLALILTLSLSLILSGFSSLIPLSTLSYAAEPALKTIKGVQQEASSSGQNQLLDKALTEKITTPRVIKKNAVVGKNLEFIFHQEPRIRIKIDGQEIEIQTTSIGGKSVNPSKAQIIADKGALYEEIISGVDLKYSFSPEGLVEEFIVKDKSAASSIAGKITQTLKLTNIKANSSSPLEHNFSSNDGKELFKFAEPFIKDAKGQITKDISINLEQDSFGYTITKTFSANTKTWLELSDRAYPVVIDPTVVVSGGIEEAEVQFGGLQRKLIFASSAFYAFYDCDASPCAGATGGRIFYKKSTDGGGTWGSAVEIDTTDTDNYNPSVYLSGNTIYVAWIDDLEDQVEVNSINTASSDALGTKCTSASPGTLSTTYTVSVAVDSGGTVYLATTDTGAGTVAVVYKLTFSGCTFTNITSAPTASTKFYLPSSGAAAVTPTLDSNWEDTSVCASNKYKTSPTKASSTMTTKSFSDADVTLKDICFAQYISDPIAGQTIGAQAIRIQMRQDEDNLKDNLFMTWLVKVVSNDGTSVTGTPVAIQTDGTELVLTTLTNRSDSKATSTAVTANSGDRLLFEVGYGGDPASGGGSHTGGVSVGDDNASDLGNNDTDTTALNPYIIFTNTVSFNGSGLAAGGRPVLVTIGTTLHMIYQDGNLSHSIYDGSGWTETNTTIASVADNFYDVTTDGTSLWLLTVSGTTATNLYKCATCTTTSTTWSSLTAPWSGQTNLTSVSITYDSSGTNLYAHAIHDTSEQAYYKSTAAGTISWSGETSYAFTAGDLGHISSPMTGAGTSQIGVVLRQGSNFEAAVLPEKTLLLLIFTPFLPGFLKKIRKAVKSKPEDSS